MWPATSGPHDGWHDDLRIILVPPPHDRSPLPSPAHTHIRFVPTPNTLPTKLQLISRKKGADQYYINFPTAVAEALELQKGETIEWIIENKANIIAHRPVVPPSPVTIA